MDVLVLAFPLVLLPWLGLLPTAAVLAFVPVGATWPCAGVSEFAALAHSGGCAPADHGCGGVFHRPLRHRIGDGFYGARVLSAIKRVISGL